MSGKDGQGTIDLFSEDDASQLMWQCDAAQRKKKIRALTGRGRPAICWPDRKNETLGTAIAQSAEQLSEFFGRE